MTLDELIARTSVPDRTIRHYQKEGLLPRWLGNDGGYTEEHVHLLAAIQCLKAEGVRKLDEIRVRIAAMSPEELAGYTFDPQNPDEDDGAGDEPDGEERRETPATAPAPLRVAPTQPVAAAAPGAAPRELWQRIVVRPGLELLVRVDAGAEAQLVAQEIRARYGAT